MSYIGRYVGRLAYLFTLLVQLSVICFLIFKISSRFSLNPIQKKGVETKINKSRYVYYYENRANVSIKEKREWDNEKLTYNHNRDGLNNLRNYTPNHPINTFRIAAIGDSFTYGLNVSTENNWVSQLEAKLNKVECSSKFEILNFGVPGYDIDYVLERNRLRAEKYVPDIYIWFIKDDDFSEPKELTLPIEQALNKSGKYSIDYYMKALEALYLRKDKQKIINEAKKKLFSYLDTHTQSKFLLVIPRNYLGYPTLSDSIELELQSYASSHKHVFLVPISISKEDIFYPYDYHFNEVGNDHFSDVLFSSINQLACHQN